MNWTCIIVGDGDREVYKQWKFIYDDVDKEIAFADEDEWGLLD